MSLDMRESLWVDEGSVYSALPTGDSPDMPSTKDRLDGLDAELAGLATRLTSIETRLGIAIAIPAEEKFLAKLATAWKWVINHKGTAVILPITLAVVSIIGTNLYRRHLEHQDRDFNNSVDGRINEKLNPVNIKLDGISQRMSTVEGKLDALILLRASKNYQRSPECLCFLMISTVL